MLGISKNTKVGVALEIFENKGMIPYRQILDLRAFIFTKFLNKTLEELYDIDLEFNINIKKKDAALALQKFITAVRDSTGMIFQNPLRSNLPRKSVPRNNVVSISHIRFVMQRALSRRTTTQTGFYKLVLFCASLGVRPSEAIGLKYSDICFERKTISIRTAKNSEKGRVLKFESILPEFYEELIGVLKEKTGDEYIITTDGDIGYRTKILLIKRALMLKHFYNAFGVEMFQFRDLRRFYGQTIVERNATINQVANHLGHKDLATTQRHYIKLREAFPKMNNFND